MRFVESPEIMRCNGKFAGYFLFATMFPSPKMRLFWLFFSVYLNFKAFKVRKYGLVSLNMESLLPVCSLIGVILFSFAAGTFRVAYGWEVHENELFPKLVFAVYR